MSLLLISKWCRKLVYLASTRANIFCDRATCPAMTSRKCIEVHSVVSLCSAAGLYSKNRPGWSHFGLALFYGFFFAAAAALPLALVCVL